MERWLILGMVCAGTGGCRGDRPDFSHINTDSSDTPSQDDTSPDSGGAAVDKSSTDVTSEATTVTGEATTTASDDSPSSTSDASRCGEGETRECGTDVGPCSKGVQTCGEDGKWIAECVGATEPGARDSCSVEGDDSDCDGEPNSQCECIGDEVEACNACGQRSCNAEIGEWGPCLPVEEPRCNEAETALEVCDESGNWETQACTNPDATNCASACATPDGVAACVISAIDGDEDGYLSAACAAAPGDDCDDTTQSVSPGSFEMCDGRDNDCDGFVDILDATVSLAGAPTRIVSGAPTDLRRVDITWHGSQFFLLGDGRARTDSGYTSVYSGYIEANGSVIVVDEILASNHSDDLYDSPRLASMGGTLGAVVRQDGRHSYGARFLTFDSNGTPLTNIAAQPLSKGKGAISAADNSFTIVSFDTPTASNPSNTFSFATGSTDGSLGAVAARNDITGEVGEVNVAHGDSVSGMVYTDLSEGQPRVQLLRWSEGNVLGPIELSPAAQSADIIALPNNRFTIAWATSGGFRLQVRTTSGSIVVCDSGEVNFGNGALEPLDAVAIAESSLGIVVAVADSGDDAGRAAAFVFNDKCEQVIQEGKPLFNDLLSPHTSEHPQEPRIAVGGGKTVIAWTAENSGSYRSYVRVMPESMCED